MTALVLLLAAGANELTHPMDTEEARSDPEGAYSDWIVVEGGAVLEEGGAETSFAIAQPAEREQFRPARLPGAQPKAGFQIGDRAADCIAYGCDLGTVFVAQARNLDVGSTTFGHALALASARGEIGTRDDVERVRREFALQRMEANVDAVRTLSAALGAIGGIVLEENDYTGLVRFQLEGESHLLSTIAEAQGVWLDPDENSVEESFTGQGMTISGSTLNGQELANVIQSELFYSEGYNGDPLDHVAMSDSWWTFDDHYGFQKPASGGPRVMNCKPQVGICTHKDSGGGISGHSTGVASILLGSVLEGQDPSIATITGQNRHSGVARGIQSAFMYRSMGALATTFPVVGPVVHSRSMGTGSTTCHGTTAGDREANALFEGGLAMFKSAGNMFHTSTSDCRSTTHGAAIGNFTVSAFSGDEQIYTGNSRGGTTTQGRGRTVVDIAAPEGIDSAAYYRDLGAGSEYRPTSDAFCCTSSAAPVTAGAALLLRDWWHAEQGTSTIDDPGLLYAMMLLMGDGTIQRDQVGDPDVAGQPSDTFDNLWGAGQLRLRMPNAEGLDGPWEFGAGSTCVRDGQNVVHYIGSDLLDPDMDTLKAVMFFYDRRHEDSTGSTWDDIDLELQRIDWNGAWVTEMISQTGDNKERVWDNHPKEQRYRLVFKGTDVSTTMEGCNGPLGEPGNRVYFAYLAEDSDREPWEFLETVRVQPDLERID